MRIPDPFCAGSYLEVSKAVLMHAPEKRCPVCDHLRVLMLQDVPPDEEVGFEVIE